MRVAYQGEAGAFSEAAVAAYFGEARTEPLPCAAFAEVFEALSAGDADAAVLPAENSYAGDVGEVYDLLRRHPVRIHGEVELPVRHFLLAVEGARLEDVRVVRSHPQALSQCREFLRARRLRGEPAYDTAAAARQVAELCRLDVAAVAAARAARRYDLRVLAGDVQDRRDNVTRFFVIAPEEAAESTAPRSGVDTRGRKCSLLFAVRDRPGALYRCLGAFAAHDVNLTKLSSRPEPGRPWAYAFFADVAGDAAAPAVQAALAELRRHTVYVRVLGSFPAAAPAHVGEAGDEASGPGSA